MKDQDSQLLCEIYDKLKHETIFTPEKLEQEWQKFDSFLHTNFSELDFEVGDLDYWEDGNGEVVKIMMDGLTIYFDFPEHENVYQLLKFATQNNPSWFDMKTSDIGFQFIFKEKSFLAIRRQSVYDFIVKIFVKIREFLNSKSTN